MLELYSHSEKLDQVLNRQDPENRNFFLTAHKCFIQERKFKKKIIIWQKGQ